MNIEIRTRDAPKGYSATLVKKGKWFSISMGRGCTLDGRDRKVAILDVEIEDGLHLHIIGGDEFHGQVESILNNRLLFPKYVKLFAVKCLAKHIGDNPSGLRKILRGVVNQAYNQGVSDTKQGLREFILGEVA